MHGEAVEVDCYVKLISDGVFVNCGQVRNGHQGNMGRTAVVEAQAIKIAFTENKLPPWNLKQLRSVGIAPEKEKIIVAESALLFVQHTNP